MLTYTNHEHFCINIKNLQKTTSQNRLYCIFRERVGVVVPPNKPALRNDTVTHNKLKITRCFFLLYEVHKSLLRTKTEVFHPRNHTNQPQHYTIYLPL